MTQPQRIGELLGGFELYDVPTTCRTCKAEFTGKAFKPADGQQRFGICESCAAVEDAPKLPPRRAEIDLRPPRRVFGEDND